VRPRQSLSRGLHLYRSVSRSWKQSWYGNLHTAVLHVSISSGRTSRVLRDAGTVPQTTSVRVNSGLSAAPPIMVSSLGWMRKARASLGICRLSARMPPRGSFTSQRQQVGGGPIFGIAIRNVQAALRPHQQRVCPEKTIRQSRDRSRTSAMCTTAVRNRVLLMSTVARRTCSQGQTTIP
jgi:hypothetical protein